MHKVTSIFVVLLLLSAGDAFAQQTDYIFEVPLAQSDEFKGPYTLGEDGSAVHSGARAVTGPFDLDGDGSQEVLLTDYSGGGRVHVIENRGVDTWELVYSTPWMDSTASVSNARYAYGADLDDDGNGEILFISGHGFSETNPNIDDLPLGMYIFEYTGTDDDYGDAPAAILQLETETGEPQPSIISEQFAVEDVDGDEEEEILIPANSSSAFDYFYIYSATGDIGDPFLSFNQELAINPRNVDLGGGSPIAMHPADLDGDGTWEISMHSWNAFNLFNIDIDEAGTYVFGDTTGAAQPWLHGTDGIGDHVSFFGGVVVDMDGDGTDEVYYPNLYTGNVSLLDYDAGDDVLNVTQDDFLLGLVENVSSLGITAGDLDADGQMELIGSGPSFGVTSYAAGETPTYVMFAEFMGGDITDPVNYDVVESTFFEPFDTTAAMFDLIRRDSLGVDSMYYEETSFSGKDRVDAHPGQGPVFVAKLAYLADADGDGANEVALSYQGVDDTTYVIDEVWNADSSRFERTIAEARPNENRAFLRIISGDGFNVDIVNERVVLPDDYKLYGNYPNPFGGETTLSFELPLEKRVTVRIYDVLGRVVTTLVDNERFAPGLRHQVTWDGTNNAGERVASGMYVYTLEWGNFKKSRTMLLMK